MRVIQVRERDVYQNKYTDHHIFISLSDVHRYPFPVLEASDSEVAKMIIQLKNLKQQTLVNSFNRSWKLFPELNIFQKMPVLSHKTKSGS